MYISDRLVAFPPGWLAVRKLRMTANGNSILNSTASWMWRACLKKEWSLHSCLSRCVFLFVLRFIGSLFIIMLQLVLMMNSSVPSGPREFDPGPLPFPRRDPATPGRPAPAVSVWRQSTGHLEPGKCLPCGPPAQSHPPVHQGGWSLGVRANSGASED